MLLLSRVCSSACSCHPPLTVVTAPTFSILISHCSVSLHSQWRDRNQSILVSPATGAGRGAGARARGTQWNGVSEKLVPVSPTECRPDILFTVAGQLYNLHILWFMAPPSQFYGSHPQTTDNWGQFFVMGRSQY